MVPLNRIFLAGDCVIIRKVTGAHRQRLDVAHLINP